MLHIWLAEAFPQFPVPEFRRHGPVLANINIMSDSVTSQSALPRSGVTASSVPADSVPVAANTESAGSRSAEPDSLDNVLPVFSAINPRLDTFVHSEAQPGSSVSSSHSRATAPFSSAQDASIWGQLFPPASVDGSSPEVTARVSDLNIELGHFIIEERIGVGGMGAVFRALDTRLQRIVALKVLGPGQSRDVSSVRRFQNEARSAARLDHDNIARVFYFGEDKGLHFIAFEYVVGINLRDLIQKRGPLPIVDALNYTLQIASALSHTAANGVVHRDIKPSNIIVMPNGRTKLVDLGLARKHTSDSLGDITMAGTTLGTFDYISPEQAKDPRNVDVRSDIYSLGCTLYHLLTGFPPYPEGTVLQKLLDHQGKEPPDPALRNPDIPVELSAVVQRMMATKPRQRYTTPQDLIAELAPIAHAFGMSSIPSESMIWSQLAPRQERFWERNLGWIVPIVLLIGLVIAVDRFPLLNSHESLPEPTSFQSGRPPARPLPETSDTFPPPQPPSSPTPGSDPRVRMPVPKTDGSPEGGKPELNASVPRDLPENPDARIPVGSRPVSPPATTGTDATAGNPVPRPGNPTAVTPGSSTTNGTSDQVTTTDNLSPVGNDNRQPADGSTSAAGTDWTGVGTMEFPNLMVSRPDTVVPFIPGATSPDKPRETILTTPTITTPLTGSPASPPATTVVPPRPFWLIPADGSQPVSKPTLAAACAAAEDGSIIEIRQESPRPIRIPTSIRLRNKKLTIRGVEGAVPWLVFTPGDEASLSQSLHMFELTQAAVEFVNLHVLLEIPEAAWSAPDAPGFAMLLGASSIQLQSVSMTVDNPANRACSVVALFTEPAASLPDTGMTMTTKANGEPGPEFEIEMRRCFVRGTADLVSLYHTMPGRISVEQCAFGLDGALLYTEGNLESISPTARVELRIKHTTAIVGNSLLRFDAGNTPRDILPVDVKSASNNIFATTTSSAFVGMRGNSGPDVTERLLNWNGERNFYEGFESFWTSQAQDFAARDFGTWRDIWMRTSGARELDPQQDGIVWSGLWSRTELSDLKPVDFALNRTVEQNPAVGGASDGADAGADLSQLPVPPNTP